MEAIRLVVWDLDETFWKGTLTEGGIEYSQRNHEMVIELSKRGIINSICSRNDRATIEKLLREKGLWDYFIFPSIDWTAKGHRLKALVEQVQLRAPTILFIDDNPMNRNEALHFVPDMQVADVDVIDGLLSNPLLKGKDDRELSRLKQYKVLEEKARDQAASGNDPIEFLRSSDIRVVIEYDIESNIDRAVELITRTNQLNFTKRRLPGDPEAAKRELRRLLSIYANQAGLVRVYDRYGDYGYVGFFVNRKTVEAGSRLLHYCFSCRTLGMNVETWLYRKMGRPEIEIVGEVLTDIKDESAIVDYISLADDDGPQRSNKKWNGRILMRGGCDMLALSHYFHLLSDDVICESAFSRDDIQIRIEHSFVTRGALETLPTAHAQAAEAIGYRPEDFKSALFETPQVDDVWIVSFWADADYHIYRHTETGFYLPFNAYPAVKGIADLTKVEPENIEPQYRENHWIGDALSALKQQFTFAGRPDAAAFENTVKPVLARAPGKVFILGCNEKGADGTVYQSHVRLNAWCKNIAAQNSNFSFIDLHQFISSEGDIQHNNLNHLDRQVYYRIYEHICEQLCQPSDALGQAAS